MQIFFWSHIIFHQFEMFSTRLSEFLKKNLFYFPGGLKNIPTQSIDNLIQSITIKGPRNFITLSSIFQTFNKLEELRIIDSNIPSIGKNTFWGVPSLRIIGKDN